MKLPPEMFPAGDYGWDYFDWWVKTFRGRTWVLERRFNEIWYSIPLWRRAVIRLIGWIKGVERDEEVPVP